MLDKVHKRKIDNSDAIYVICPGGYIGESTRSEMDYAVAAGKKVITSMEVDDFVNKLIGSRVHH